MHVLELHLCTCSQALCHVLWKPHKNSSAFLGVNLLPLHICHFTCYSAEFGREHIMSYLVFSLPQSLSFFFSFSLFQMMMPCIITMVNFSRVWAINEIWLQRELFADIIASYLTYQTKRNSTRFLILYPLVVLLYFPSQYSVSCLVRADIWPVKITPCFIFYQESLFISCFRINALKNC